MDTGLFNLFTRQQVYVEGVKNWFAIDLKRYLKLLSDAIKDFLAKLGVKSMGDLSKAQLSALLKRIDKRSNEILSNYSSEFLAELRRFGRIATTQQRSSIAALLPKVDVSGVSLSSVWSATKDRIIPAFGKNVKDAAVDLVNAARDKIRTRLNSGFADNEDVSDTSTAVTNLDVRADPSTLKTIGNGITSFLSTAIQHAAQTASDFVGSVVFACYQWCSVIDSRTTPICRERDGNVYRYGDGPLPPAHNRCRSHTVPVECGDGSPTPTFFDWLTKQPASFLADALGDSFARKVANGSFSVKDLPDVASCPALSLDEFELKTEQLTA